MAEEETKGQRERKSGRGRSNRAGERQWGTGRGKRAY